MYFYINAKGSTIFGRKAQSKERIIRRKIELKAYSFQKAEKGQPTELFYRNL